MSPGQIIRGAALAAATALAAGPSPVLAQDPVKVGFVYVGPIGDEGWTYQHDLGRLAVEEAFGEAVTTTYVESVPEGADAERVIRQLAEEGHALIFTTSFGYMNPTIRVAQEFPDVAFEHATGYRTAENVGIYNARFYEGRYLAGMVAGAMTGGDVLGYVAAFPIPEVVMGINAFTLGAREVNPEAETRVVWINSWFDPGREREAAETLISQGADVITHHTDSTAVVQAAEAATDAGRTAYAIGYNSDMSRFAPDATLTSVINIWDEYYIGRVRMVIDGTWEPADFWGGIAEGTIVLAPIADTVPAEVQAAVAERSAAIADGSFSPFQGPILAPDGSVLVPEGTRMTDEEILQMNFYVRGVAGELPQ